MAVRPLATTGLVALTISLGACQDSSVLGGVSGRSLAPVPAQTMSLMQTKGMRQTDPIVIRAYKKEAEMEVWKRTGTGQYALLKTFPICRWSGQLGPKIKQGDRQAPEGFYTITPGQMNPNSAYYLSFDVGYPNAIDRAKGATGNYIMVHGTCSSAGCFAMTDASIAEVYALARDAFSGGQRAVQFQSYPFRMTAQNMAKFRNDPNVTFWKNLKEGSDYFEALREEPRVAACGTRYAFGGSDVSAGSCTPRVEPMVAEKRDRDNREIAELVAKGERATRVVYEDGGQNPVFSPQARASAFASLQSDKELPYSAGEYARHNLGDVSRPESLAAGPREIEIDAKGRPILVAAASADALGPTKAAAAALKKGEKQKAPPATLMARQEPATAPKEPETTGRITVADADGGMISYQKLLGGILGKQDAEKTGAAAASPEESASAADAKSELAKAPSVTPSTRLAAHVAKKAGLPAKEGTSDAAATKKVVAAPAQDAGLRGRN